MTGRITVFFRFDDYSETSCTPVELALIDQLRKHACCATFAVIPAVTDGSYHTPGERPTNPLGAAKTEILRKAVAEGVVDVALHGYDHRTIKAEAPHSEFAGLSVTEQADKIRRGAKMLRDLLHQDVIVFVPPWNSYDEATLVALEQEGLKCVSANRFGPVRADSLSYAPNTTPPLGLRNAVEAARASSDADPVIGVLFHEYDFKEFGGNRTCFTAEEFGAQLEWLRAQPDVDVRSITELTLAEGATLGHGRYRANLPLPFENVMPPFLSRTEDDPLFHVAKAARRIRVSKTVVTAALYVVAAVIAMAIGAALPGGAGYLLIGLPALALLLARSLVKQEVHFKTFLTIVLLSSVLAGALL